MTTTTHPSRLPEQEPTSPTAVVLCDGEAWLRTGIDQWDSLFDWNSWEALRANAAEKGGATLYDLADLPTRLTEVQKGAVRFIDAKLQELEDSSPRDAIYAAFPGAFTDDIATATWESGGDTAELLRVALMKGAHVVAVCEGVTYAGAVYAAHGGSDDMEACIAVGYSGGYTIDLEASVDQVVTVTAPKPPDPTGGDLAVLASVRVDATRRVFFRAEDGKWVMGRDCKFGVWTTENLIDVKRLSAPTIAELMGGEQACDREAARERGWRAYKEGGGPDEVVDAVLAALPDPMGGAS